MSKHSKDSLATIERVVFLSDNPIVVALTGGWGEGKTHFWKEVVVPEHASQKPGYVSVFGAESLAVIRERVAFASARFGDLAESGVLPDWMQKVTGPVAAGVRKAASFWGGKIGISDSLAVELLQSFGLKPGWVVCIDDVERLSEKIGFENFLGYVTELRDRWKLKVVLIYNREPIDKDEKSAFHVYQEKVIDRVIPFALDLSAVVDLVLKNVQIPGLDVHGEVLKRVNILALRNIRILARARNYFDEVVQVLGQSASSDFLGPSLASLLLFSYTKFSNQKPPSLTFAMLRNHSEWNDRFRRNAGVGVEDPPEADAAKLLLERYGYMMSDELDLLLISFVETDVLDAQQLRQLYEKHVSDTGKQATQKELKAVWDTLYHGSFTNNSDQLCDALERALPPNLPYISHGELDIALTLLETFGRNQSAAKIFAGFTEIRGNEFELDDETTRVGTFSYRPMNENFEAMQARRTTDNRALEEVMASAFADRFVSDRDAERLAQFTSDDFVEYFMSHDRPKLTSKLRLLVQDNNQSIRSITLEAIRKLGEKSPLNRIRMEGMGLLPRDAGGR